LQPPLVVAVANHDANAVLIAACVWHEASVVFAGQVNTTEGAFVTVNVRIQVTGASQLDVTVNVTEATPPQAGGAPLLLFDNVELHPPLIVAVANHAVKAVLIADWVWHDATVVFTGQLNTTTGAAVTVKVAMHVAATPQVDVAVNVTDAAPPHAGGAPLLLFDKLELQPPVKEAVANQVVKAASIAPCV
jgi:hypothetical protein